MRAQYTRESIVLGKTRWFIALTQVMRARDRGAHMPPRQPAPPWGLRMSLCHAVRNS